jgi:hypothetical protein
MSVSMLYRLFQAIALHMTAPAPHKTGMLLQLAQTWPNFWQLQHCVTPI